MENIQHEIRGELPTILIPMQMDIESAVFERAYNDKLQM